MNRISTNDITSTSWTKLELNDSIDNYKFLQFTNQCSVTSNTLDVGNSVILSVKDFKEKYNSSEKYIRLYLFSANRAVMFYYNSVENVIYETTEYTGYYPVLYGIK